MELRKIHRGGEKRASYLLTLPQQFLKALSIKEGDYVSLSLQDDRIVMAPVQERERGNGSVGSRSPANQAHAVQDEVPGYE
jgi:antitoxin component of MazEF toxin-antitoxin module